MCAARAGLFEARGTSQVVRARRQVSYNIGVASSVTSVRESYVCQVSCALAQAKGFVRRLLVVGVDVS